MKVPALLRKLPKAWRAKLLYAVFSKFYVPLIGHVGAQVLSIDEKGAKVLVPLKRGNKNHLNAMYFGALCVGADVASGILAVMQILEAPVQVDFVFKDCNARFLKRAETNVLFVCDDGARIKSAVDDAIKSGQRIELSVDVAASSTGTSPELVAQFQLCLSMKARPNKRT